MKKVFVLVSCVAVVLILSNVSFAQSEEAPVPDPSQLSVQQIIAESQPDGAVIWRPAAPQALPFGYPPYPMVDGYPAYGIPYSYPRAPRRLGSRFGSRFAPPPFQPHQLPVPGAVPGAVPLHVPPMVAPPMTLGQVPQLQETLGAVPAVSSQQQPTVYYRPTPVKNFMTLMMSPRPYIGYDPYAGYPPYPGYIPPQ